MPINNALLIAAPMLQDLLVDKNGLPMAAGTITCYHDNSRTTLKNWYYQTGSPGAYNWIPLPNPLTLSAAGTICDINGVDTIPFWYPYDELDETQRDAYYVTIVSYDQTTTITRANFPYNGIEGSEALGFNFENYIINNVFWRNLGTASLTNILIETVAPSQHDGFRYPDIQFIKNITGGADTVTFIKFLPALTPALSGDITPEFYLNHSCTNSQSGENQKCYQFPVSLHLSSITSTQFTFTIQAQNNGAPSPGQNILNIALFQDTGTGTTPPMPMVFGSCVLNTSWEKYTFTANFPSTVGLNIGLGGDDAYYIQVQLPAGVPCNVNFTKPSLYLTDVAPDNDFSTYDQIDAIINSPRTGDLRVSVNSFCYFGWVPMNDGTIGNASSGASTRSNMDTWQLFNQLWIIASPYDNGGMSPFNPICQMYSSGTPVNYSTNAITDFNLGNQLALTKMMGRVLMGTVPLSLLLSGTYAQTVTASNSGGTILFTPQSTANMFQGMPVSFNFTTGGSLPGNIVANAVYYVSLLNSVMANTFVVSTTYAGSITGTSLVAWSSSGSNVILNLDYTGTNIGEYAHTQIVGELAVHNHSATTSAVFHVASNTSSNATSLTGGTNLGNLDVTEPASRFTTTIGNTPSGTQTAFNVTQPGTFYNIFIKL